MDETMDILGSKKPPEELRGWGRGDCLNMVEASRPSSVFLAAMDHDDRESASQIEARSFDDDDDDAPTIEDQREDLKKPSYTSGQFAVDLIASVVTFFLTCVIYVSGGQSIFGKMFQGDLVFAAVDSMFSGSALTGLCFPLFSSVPWAVGAVDVGFLPLLSHAADIVYHVVVVDDIATTLDPEEQAAVVLSTFIAVQALLFFCVGLSLSALGYFELTKLCNYLPYPVTAGLLASIGVSLVKSGLSVASKKGFEVSTQLGLLWLAAALALAGLSSFLKQRLRVPAYAATPAVVATGIVVLFVAAFFCGIPSNELAAYGALFEWNEKKRGWWGWTGIDLGKVRWDVVFGCHEVVIAACVIAALKIGIKCGSFASLFVTAEIDPDHEMRLVGLSNCFAALCASAGNAHSFSGLKLQQQLGATTKGAAAIVPLWCFLAWFAGIGGMMRIIPRFVFGAMLVELGYDYVETYLVYPLARSSFDAVDATTLLAIVVTAIATNLLDAIGLGLVFSLVGVSRRLAQRSIIRATLSGRTTRSTIERTPAVMRALDDLADAVEIVELVGYVFFGSAHEFVDAVVDRLKRQPPLQHLVLDLTNLLPIFDVTSLAAFEKVLALAQVKGFSVFVAPSRHDSADALRSGLGDCGPAHDLFKAVHGTFFESIDDALEAAEDQLLVSASQEAGGSLLRRQVFSFQQSPVNSSGEEQLLRDNRPTEELVRDWLENATENVPSFFTSGKDALVAAVASIARVSHHIRSFSDPDQPPAMAFVVEGRLKLLDGSGITIRKLGRGNALAVGDYYIQDYDNRRAYSVKQSTPNILLLYINYSDLADLERYQPHVAIDFHKLMARSLAQKNRISKLASKK